MAPSLPSPRRGDGSVIPPIDPGPVSGTTRSPPPLRGDAGELGDDPAAVGLEDILLAVRHQVDVELVDADALELAQLGDALLGVPDHAEAVADLVAHERAVRGADARVVLVVV